ncbi:MAG: hypothetical protein IJF69_03235 [Clostridia bacterium]|nr:hypothetical protein [Clostridia bacterium]
MMYSTNLYNTKTTSVIIPVFTPEKGEKAEEENVRRMNDFYDELKRSVFAYTESDSFPKNGRYFAKTLVTKNDDCLEIKVVLRLRSEGKTLSSRTFTHTWKDGVVIKKQID